MVKQRSRLERRIRRAARVALYGSLALVAALVLGVRPYLRTWRGASLDVRWPSVHWAELREVQLLQHYVQIDTTWTEGNEIPGARFLAAELEKAGIPATVEVLAPRYANVWAVLPGRDPHALVLHSHIDTDPIWPSEKGKWSYPPFSGAVVPPWIYGRGVFDMKSVAIAQLEAFIRLKQSGRPLPRTVVFLATGSEEHGSELGARWVLARHPELARSFWAVLTEGGVVEALTGESVKYWGIETAQKHYLDYTFCSPSRERLVELQADLRDTGRPLTGLRVEPEVAEMLTAYAGTRTRADYRDLVADFGQLPRDLPRFATLPPYLQSLFRDEAIAGTVSPDPNGGYRLRVVLKLLPGSDLPAARARLLPEWITHGLSWTMSGDDVAVRGSSTRHPVYRALAAAVRTRWPDTTVGPFFLVNAANDGRFFRRAGIASYGFSPFVVVSSDTLQIGRGDERMALPAYVDGVRLYAHAVDRILRDSL